VFGHCIILSPTKSFKKKLKDGSFDEYVTKNDQEYNAQQAEAQGKSTAMHITFMNQVNVKAGQLGTSLDHTGFGFSGQDLGKSRFFGIKNPFNRLQYLLIIYNVICNT